MSNVEIQAYLASLSPLQAHRLSAIREALPLCELADDRLRAAIEDARCWYGTELLTARAHRGPAKDGARKVAQTLRAAHRLRGLLNEPLVEWYCRSADLRSLETTGEPVLPPSAESALLHGLDLDGLIAKLEAAVDAPPRADPRKNTALRTLIVDLAHVYRDATGEHPRQPTYDPVLGTISGAFVDLIRLSTFDILGSSPPSDEALRHVIREAFDVGAVGQKKSEGRLYPSRDNAPSQEVSETNEADTDGERRAH